MRVQAGGRFLTPREEIRAVMQPMETMAERADKFVALLLAYIFSIALQITSGAVVILIVISVMDHWLGTRVAKIKNIYRHDFAALGKIGKASNVAVVLFVWGVESWIAFVPKLFDSRGLLGAIIAFWFAADQFRSYIRWRMIGGINTPDWLVRMAGIVQMEIDDRMDRIVESQVRRKKAEDKE
jgi:hypothetical protein